jgi:hypothetical protein
VKRRLGGAAVLLCLAGTALGAVHCDARLAHAFGGYAYNETADCFYLSGAVDVIAGADPGQCPNRLRCYVAPDSNVYVTDDACDSPPDYQDETHSTSGPCVKALAAFARPGNSLCPDAGYGLGGGPQ